MQIIYQKDIYRTHSNFYSLIIFVVEAVDRLGFVLMRGDLAHKTTHFLDKFHFGPYTL